MIEANGMLNEELIKKLNKYFIKPKIKRALIAGGILSIALALFAMSAGDRYVSIGFFCGTIFFIIEYFYIKNKMGSILIKRIEEVHEDKEYRYKIIFEEDGVIVRNLNEENGDKIKYKVFTRLAEIPEAFCIFTEANQFIIILKENLDEEHIEELKSLIYKKCINLK